MPAAAPNVDREPSIGERLSTGVKTGLAGGVIGGLVTASMRYSEYDFTVWKAITPKVVGIGALVGAAIGLGVGIATAGNGRGGVGMAVAGAAAGRPAQATPPRPPYAQPVPGWPQPVAPMPMLPPTYGVPIGWSTGGVPVTEVPAFG